MNKSPYFSELSRSYNAEIDDLITDSAGKSVLQKRLNDKRREINAILPMIELSCEMVAVVFFDAFEFNSPEIMRQIVLSEPTEVDFVSWDTLKVELTLADWALPLVESALKVSGGDVFLVITAALEFLRTKSSSEGHESERRAAEDFDQNDDDNDADDLGEAGAGWLAEQGFESLDSGTP